MKSVGLRQKEIYRGAPREEGPAQGLLELAADLFILVYAAEALARSRRLFGGRRYMQEAPLCHRRGRLDEGGDAVAMSILGFAYDKGEGVPEDEAQSRYWYKRSAEHGNGRGQANHACKLWNQGKKLQAALLWMEAATRGDPYACIEVAALYDKGLVGHPAQDKELAKRWYLKALACEERGDGDGFDPDEEDAAKANAWLNANADVAAPWFDAPDRRSQDA